MSAPDEFNKALSIMNRAASSKWLPNARDFATPQLSTAAATAAAARADVMTQQKQQVIDDQKLLQVCMSDRLMLSLLLLVFQ